MSEAYRSALRGEQKASTRARILDGLARVMASGVAELSIPAVAKEAGVSIPTVYRHFPNKKALLAALAPHVERKSGAGEVPDPRDPESLAASAHELFRRLDSLDAATRAAMASRLGKRMRRESMISGRRALIERALDPATRGMPAVDRERLINVVLILWSSAALQAFKDYLGLGAEQAADHVAWAIRALTQGRK
jgi:AcrR family transcriptional regulator